MLVQGFTKEDPGVPEPNRGGRWSRATFGAVANINAQAALAGRPLTLNPVVTRSDSVHFRWSKDGSLVSTDSILAFAALLLFVFSGGAHKLMNPMAAKAAALEAY